jgi:hypothetical protein
MICPSGGCTSGDMGTAPDLLPDYNNPGAPGAYQIAVTPLTMTSQLQLQTGTLYLPSDDGVTLSPKQATYPFVLLAPALRMTDPQQLAPYAQRLASHGIIVAQYRPTDEANQLAYRSSGLALINDLGTGMEPAVGTHADTSHVGLAGYDLGGEMSAAIAAQSATISGLFLLDPRIVNASGPSVQIDGLAAMTQVKLAGNQTIAILGQDISQSGMSGAPPCTSPIGNYQQFYANSMVSTIEIDFPTAAHADFVSVYPDATICGGGTMNPSDTQTLAIKYMSAYFQWTLLGQTAAMDYISATGKNFTADVQQYGLVPSNK